MPQTSDTALLILDFQVGIGDQPYAKSAAQRAAAALKAGRAAGLLVVFSKVNFRAGYRDVADSNKAFALIKMKNLFPPDESKLISILQPGHDEIVVDKDRFCAFSGNDLKEVLRSGGIKHLVMAGVATSGVILSTFTLAADEDYSITILSDACADPMASLHQELMTNLPRSATVLTVDQWIASLPPRVEKPEDKVTGTAVTVMKNGTESQSYVICSKTSVTDCAEGFSQLQSFAFFATIFP